MEFVRDSAGPGRHAWVFWDGSFVVPEDAYSRQDWPSVLRLYAQAAAATCGDLRMLPANPKGRALLDCRREELTAAPDAIDDPKEADRLCVLIDDIPGCAPDTVGIFGFSGSVAGPWVRLISGPAADIHIATAIIHRDIGYHRSLADSLLPVPDGPPDEPDNDNDADADALPESDATLADFTHPGGLIEEIVDWIVLSAQRPSRELALSAVIPFVGALIGRRYETSTGLRSNVYTVALAGSGFGKDHARTQLKRLASAAGLDRFMGPNRFMSASALRATVMKNPSVVAQIDEFGGFMRQVNDRTANIHSQLIRTDVMDMFSAAGTYFEGSAYASVPAEKIYNPNLCIYGTSTPDDFWGTLTTLNTSDGLLARFILFDVTPPRPSRRTPPCRPDEIPAGLIDRVRALALSGRNHGNLSGATTTGATSVRAALVPFDAEATATFDALSDRIDAEEATTDSRARAFTNRAVEHAKKLGLILAVATDAEHPVVTAPMAVWATDLAWHSTASMVAETVTKIADTQREANWNTILEIIRKRGDAGITSGDLGKYTKRMARRDREEIVSDLTDAGLIRSIRVVKAGRGRPSERLVAA